SVNWKDVKDYLKTYVGKFYETAESKEVIYIGSDLPDEYTGSNYTYKLKGTVAKAKANATQGLKEMIEIDVHLQSFVIVVFPHGGFYSHIFDWYTLTVLLNVASGQVGGSCQFHYPFQVVFVSVFPQFLVCGFKIVFCYTEGAILARL
ncbi:MAG: hypothetical protein IKH49_10250, partial [Bacteroidales bacterium]|nr:hypothetical protein [Bacteroidales bacterium]